MQKPKQRVSSPYWDFHEVEGYLLYMGCDFNKMKVWHSIADAHNISNGSYFTIEAKIDKYDDEYMEEFKLALQEHFPGEEDFYFWVEW